MAAEVAYVAAKNADMPRFLARTNAKDVPASALIMTSALIQLVLLTTLVSDDAFTFTLKLCSALSLVPYLLAAAYALKLGMTGETYETNRTNRRREALIAGIATFYTVFLIYAAGLKFLLLSFVIYAPGTILFRMARREQGKRLFSPPELALCVIAIIGAIVGVVGLTTGWITI